MNQAYWAKPVPTFGDPNARLFIIGLAPAAHGGNRTGRIFTGDSSGDWLIRALHETGLANRPESDLDIDIDKRWINFKRCLLDGCCNVCPT